MDTGPPPGYGGSPWPVGDRHTSGVRTHREKALFSLARRQEASASNPSRAKQPLRRGSASGAKERGCHQWPTQPGPRHTGWDTLEYRHTDSPACRHTVMSTLTRCAHTELSSHMPRSPDLYTHTHADLYTHTHSSTHTTADTLMPLLQPLPGTHRQAHAHLADPRGTCTHTPSCVHTHTCTHLRKSTQVSTFQEGPQAAQHPPSWHTEAKTLPKSEANG